MAPILHARSISVEENEKRILLCQKLFCQSLEEARQVVEFCDQASVRLMINENWRWQAWYRKAKEVMDSGASH